MADPTFPRTWTGSNFKQPRVSQKVRTKLKRGARDATEKKNKGAVRVRDNKRTKSGCRFPLCGCKDFGLAKHVAHLEHKGMGGNKAEDRSEPQKMIQVCIARHREHVFSIDKGTLRCVPMTSSGTDGVVAWEINLDELRQRSGEAFTRDVQRFEAFAHEWAVLARECPDGTTVVLQPRILAWLAEMQF